MSKRYILLPGGMIAPCNDLLEWAEWMETAERVLARTEFEGSITVSTVFLGLDCSFDSGPPLLFETMVFGGPYDGFQSRHHTFDNACVFHNDFVRACIDKDGMRIVATGPKLPEQVDEQALKRFISPQPRHQRKDVL